MKTLIFITILLTTIYSCNIPVFDKKEKEETGESISAEEDENSSDATKSNSENDESQTSQDGDRSNTQSEGTNNAQDENTTGTTNTQDGNTSIVNKFPDCFLDKIAGIKNNPVSNPPAKILSYIYNGQKVFLVETFWADDFISLYDENCNIICAPSGGLTGAGDGKCKDFYTISSNELIVWQDDRK